jgi:hypothetical protein
VAVLSILRVLKVFIWEDGAGWEKKRKLYLYLAEMVPERRRVGGGRREERMKLNGGGGGSDEEAAVAVAMRRGGGGDKKEGGGDGNVSLVGVVVFVLLNNGRTSKWSGFEFQNKSHDKGGPISGQIRIMVNPGHFHPYHFP